MLLMIEVLEDVLEVVYQVYYENIQFVLFVSNINNKKIRNLIKYFKNIHKI